MAKQETTQTQVGNETEKARVFAVLINDLGNLTQNERESVLRAAAVFFGIYWER